MLFGALGWSAKPMKDSLRCMSMGLTELGWSVLNRIDILLFLNLVSEPFTGPSTAKMPLDVLSLSSLNRASALLGMPNASATSCGVLGPFARASATPAKQHHRIYLPMAWHSFSCCWNEYKVSVPVKAMQRKHMCACLQPLSQIKHVGKAVPSALLLSLHPVPDIDMNTPLAGEVYESPSSASALIVEALKCAVAPSCSIWMVGGLTQFGRSSTNCPSAMPTLMANHGRLPGSGAGRMRSSSDGVLGKRAWTRNPQVCVRHTSDQA